MQCERRERVRDRMVNRRINRVNKVTDWHYECSLITPYAIPVRIQLEDSLRWSILENSILLLGSRVQSINNRCIHLPGGRIYIRFVYTWHAVAGQVGCTAFPGVKWKFFTFVKNLHHFLDSASSWLSKRLPRFPFPRSLSDCSLFNRYV